MVCEHGEGQPLECLEDSVRCQYIPVKGVLFRPELRHLCRRQVHCDRLRRQEGHSVRGDLLGTPVWPLLVAWRGELLDPPPPLTSLTTPPNLKDHQGLDYRPCRPIPLRDWCSEGTMNCAWQLAWLWLAIGADCNPMGTEDVNCLAVFWSVPGPVFGGFIFEGDECFCNVTGWSSALSLQQLLPGRLVKIVHNGVIKTFYIYIL